MKRYSLYIHINKVNGKVYIGISQYPKRRWGKEGIRYKGNIHFWSAIQKYGWDGFLHIIVRTDLTLEEANELERRLIYLYRADNCKYGYNNTKGGDGCDKDKDSYSKEYRREQNRKYREKYREKNTGKYKGKYKEGQKEYRRRYKEEHNEAYHITYYKNHKEKYKEYQRKYLKKIKANE